MAKLLTCGFHGFSLNCESFPMNHGLVDWQYTIFHSKCESFPPQSFCHIWYLLQPYAYNIALATDA